MGRILRIGLPAAGENMNYWLALMTVTTFTARLGGDSLAIQSYSLQIERVVLLFSLSLGLGTEILIGHLVGAGQFEEAYHTLLKSVRTGLILVSCAILPIALFAPYALGCFTNDLVIIAGGTLLLRLGILLEPGRVFNVIVINSLRATGDVWFPISMCAVSTWCVWVPLAWMLAITLKSGMPGIWISMIVDEWLRGLMMHRRWRQRHWMQSARRSHALSPAGPATPRWSEGGSQTRRLVTESTEIKSEFTEQCIGRTKVFGVTRQVETSRPCPIRKGFSP